MLRACGWASLLLLSLCCRAQQKETPVYTLKVYANLVQVPTLVLDSELEPLPPIQFDRFLVSLDGGKKFTPTHVRMEGDDPLSISILLDLTGDQRHLIAGFADAAARMAEVSLHEQDQVTVYALKCNLIRTADQEPARPARVKSAIETALHAPQLDKPANGGTCQKKVFLWGAMVAVLKGMSDSPGRRVMLVVSDGADSGSVTGWRELHDYAGGQGAAIFGMNDGFVNLMTPWSIDRGDPFHSLCESTGGMVIDADDRDLEKRLEKWVALLRNRYVVEFPRPQQMGMGFHNIVVSIKRSGRTFVTLAGVSVTLPDSKITTDPNYLPSDAGADIPVGKRREQPQ
jgi:hypothetical protein